MGTEPERLDAWVRRLGAVAIAGALAALLVVVPVVPAQASVGGSAEATGLRGQAPEVALEVTASGAVSAVQPILDRLTRDPILSGRQEIAAEVTTPESPAGAESDVIAERRIPGLVTVAEISAETQRIQDEELSAQARTGEVHVGLLGLDVLQVGEVHARATTHPSEDPTAYAQEPQVQFFSREVSVPADEPVDINEHLSTADALDALESAFPGLRSLVQALGGVFEAGGGVQVQMGRTAEADVRTGAASAVGFYASVHLDLDVQICIPNRSGDCLAEVSITTDATVLDLVMAQTSVQRPETVPVIERVDWGLVIPVIAAGALVLFALGLVLGRWRRRDATSLPDDAPDPGSTGRRVDAAESDSPASRTGTRR